MTLVVLLWEDCIPDLWSWVSKRWIPFTLFYFFLRWRHRPRSLHRILWPCTWRLMWPTKFHLHSTVICGRCANHLDLIFVFPLISYRISTTGTHLWLGCWNEDRSWTDTLQLAETEGCMASSHQQLRQNRLNDSSSMTAELLQNRAFQAVIPGTQSASV